MASAFAAASPGRSGSMWRLSSHAARARGEARVRSSNSRPRKVCSRDSRPAHVTQPPCARDSCPRTWSCGAGAWCCSWATRARKTFCFGQSSRSGHSGTLRGSRSLHATHARTQAILTPCMPLRMRRAPNSALLVALWLHVMDTFGSRDALQSRVDPRYRRFCMPAQSQLVHVIWALLRHCLHVPRMSHFPCDPPM